MIKKMFTTDEVNAMLSLGGTNITTVTSKTKKKVDELTTESDEINKTIADIELKLKSEKHQKALVTKESTALIELLKKLGV